MERRLIYRAAVLLVLWQLPLPQVHAQLIINEFLASNDATLLDDFGESSDWIEVYNTNSVAVPTGGWRLSNVLGDTNGWAFPNLSIPANDFVVVFASGRNITTNGIDALHTDFKLGANGDYLALIKPDHSYATEFSPEYPAQEQDISYGFEGGQPRYFITPTPGTPNTNGLLGLVADTSFSIDRGFYTNAFTTEISVATPGATIVYTLDSSAPSLSNGIQVTGAGTNHPIASVTITNTVVVRAGAFKTDYRSSNIDTHSYIFLDQVVGQPNNPPNFPTAWKTVAADYEMDPDITTHPTYGGMMIDSLRALPSLSISTATDNLFDATTGIYANPTSAGVAWERATSVELFNPDNSKEFQVNCGLRIQGGFFRSPTATQKHSFRLLFKGEYGPGRLNHELFPGTDAVDSFDTFVLRAGGNDGYSWGGAGTTVQWTRDNFGRELMGALGHPSPHGRFVHLYLNGLYWGLYNIAERPNEDFSADYFGGEAADWDANNAGQYKNGDATAWNALQAAASAATNLTAYYAMQGLFPDGTRDPSKDVLFDRTNYMDYMMVNIWGGNWDWPNKNYWYGRLRTTESTGFKFYMWDFENTMGNNRGRSPLNMVTPRSGIENSGVGQPHNQLKDHSEYQVNFADRVHRAFFNGGELTPEKLIPHYSNLVAGIEQAVVAETARWGDDNAATPHNLQEWQNERDYLLQTYLPQRSDIVLGQFVANGLYPSLEAPTFNQHGGIVPRGFELSMTAPIGTIYYTINGNDPRNIGGTIHSNATIYTTPITLNQPAMVRSRSYDGGTWSALNESLFVLSESPIRISEIMIQPAALSSNENSQGRLRSDFEYIELYNSSTQTVDLTTLQLSGGIQFDFSTSAVQSLAPNTHLLVLNNLTAFTARYANWALYQVAGEFTGDLNNAEETIVLSETLKGDIQSFTTRNDRGWPLSAHGAGHSLVPTQEDGLDHGPNWRASTFRHGSPGMEDPAPIDNLWVNEIAANTSNPSNDWIEVYSPSGLILADWYLSDDADDLKKWAIPNGTLVNDWLSFDEQTGFNNPPGSGFAFDRGGEHVFLSHLPGNDTDRVADAFAFKAQLPGETWGRFPDGLDPLRALHPTRDAANQLLPAGIIIHEVMYHPAPNDLHPADNYQDEYMVLQNTGTQPITLQNASGPWRIDGEADFVFPTNTTLSAGAFLTVVPFDPNDAPTLSAFAALYGISSSALSFYGPFSGKLSNRSGRLALEQPQGANWAIIDEVLYADSHPFPREADGLGAALHRSGYDSWLPGAPTLDSDVVGLAPLIRTEPAKDVTWNSAYLNADLISTGSALAVVFAYYGTSDGGMQTNTWDHCIQVAANQVGMQSIFVDELLSDTHYYFRFRAANAAGSTWSAFARTFTTSRDPRDGFEHNMKLTFHGYTKSEALTNFPALVRLDTNILDYTTFYSDSGHDLLFLDDQQRHLVAYEIEAWDTNGTSTIWVQVPTLTDSNTCTWAYWGNPDAAVTIPVADIPGLELWLDAATLGLADASPVTSWIDQSVSGRDASESTDPPTYVENVINGLPVVRFDGVNDHMSFSNAGLSARSIFFVTRVNTGAKGLAGMIGIDGGDKGIRRIGTGDWRHPGDGNDFSNPAGSTFFVNGSAGGTIAENTWHVAAATRESSGNTAYNSLGGYFNGREYGGDVAEIIVYNRVLTLEEQDQVGSYLSRKYQITTDYSGSSSGTARAQHPVWDNTNRSVLHLNDQADDASSPSFDATIFNAQPSSDGVAAGAFTFDGVDDYLDLDGTVVATELTASLWMRSTALLEQTLMDKWPNDNSGMGFRWRADANGGIEFSVGSGNNSFNLSAQNSYTSQQWVHLAATYRNGTARLFVNGQQQVQQAAPGAQSVFSPSQRLRMGASLSVSEPDFLGALDEVRISSVERSACWLLASYLNQQPGSTFVQFSQALDDVPDSDGDQLPDQWEIAVFGDLTRDGTQDSDGDTLLDRDEFVAGTHPLNSNSRLFLLPATTTQFALAPALQWPSSAGKRYTLSRTTALDQPWQPFAIQIVATPPLNTYPIPPQNGARTYYRVQVSN